MAWVGSPILEYKNHPSVFPDSPLPPLETLLERGFSNLQIQDLDWIPSDIGGCLSLLEAEIVRRVDSLTNPDFGNVEDLTISFYCYSEHVSYYEGIFFNFISNIESKYLPLRPIRLYQKTLLYKVVGIESVLEEFKAIDTRLFHLLITFFKFITDERIQDVHHLVNFKDLFNYCLLYLYGGYTMDTNVYAVFQNPSEFLTSPRFDLFRTSQRSHGVHFQEWNFNSCINTPLDCFDPIFLPNAKQSPPSLSPSGQLLCVNTLDRTLIRLLNSLEVKRLMQAQSKGGMPKLLAYFSILNVQPISQYTDVFAMRSPAHTEEVLTKIHFVLNNFFRLYSIFFIRSGVSPNLMRDQIWQLYIACYNSSVTTVLLASVLHRINHPTMHIDPIEKDHDNFWMSESYTITGTTTKQALDFRVFVNFPFVKFFKSSHHVKGEHLNHSMIRGELDAIKEIILPHYKDVDSFAGLKVDFESIFEHRLDLMS